MTTRLFRLLLSTLILCTALLAGAVFLHNRAVDQATELVMHVNAGSLGIWDSQTLLEHASDTLLQDPGEGFYHSYFTALRRLGALQEINNIRFTMTLGPPWQLYRIGRAEYTMRANFSYGYANVRIGLERRNNRWRISEYQVLTPLLSS